MTPTAILFGIDGLLAGGPVVGYLPISEFIADIDESLHPEHDPEVPIALDRAPSGA